MEIQFASRALRQYRKLTPDIKRDVMAGLAELKNWPHVRGVKSLQGRNDYRLRVGRYRMIFAVDGDIIWVTDIVIRNESTY